MWDAGLKACNDTDMNFLLQLAGFLTSPDERVVAEAFQAIGSTHGRPAALCGMLLGTAIAEMSVRYKEQSK